MKGRTHTVLFGLAVLCGTFSAPTSFAADRTCSALIVEADAVVRGRWPELPDQIRKAFDGRNDVDACARVRITSSGRSVVVEVALPDGRSASRPAARREDLLPTLEALLLLPLVPDLATALPTEPSAMAAAAVPLAVDARAGAVRPDLVVRSSPSSTASPPSRFGIELSLSLGAHVGDGQRSAGVGATSLLEVAGWLVGFNGRADRYDATASAPVPMGALEIGLLGGRRFRTRDLSFDVVTGPALSLRGGWRIATLNPASGTMTNPVTQSSSNSTLVPRFGLGGRLTFRARSTVRTFIGIDGDVGAVGPIPPRQLGTAQGLPVWTVGLTLGATVGTL